MRPYIDAMPIAVRGLTLGLDEPEDLLPDRAAKRLRVKREDIRVWALVRRSLDARRHDQLGFVYTVELALSGPPRREAQLVKRLRRADVALIKCEEPPLLEPGSEPLPGRPVVVGFGPSGMFAALLLARHGYRPLVIDRGPDVKTRHRDILVGFYREHRFNPESNLLFGEGGAGTYSDGKLYTRVNDPRIRFILETFYHHGAEPDILIDGRPHIGSDKLPGICRRIRQRIEQLGGEIRFAARLDDVVMRDGALSAVVVNGETIACGPVILAVGHSARDTLRMLGRRGVTFEPKPFQLGVRIEHPQAMVDRWQYGPHCGHHRLPPAEYHLIAKGAAGLRGDMFSFCMCPGGIILPTNESPGEISTNGASRSRRNSPLANSGLVVTIDPREAHAPVQTDPLAAFDFLEQIERTAFEITGQSYKLPAQRACDFIQGRPSDGKLETSYPLGGQWSDLRRILPEWVAQSIARGIEQLGRRLPGFGGAEALVAAPESRASGPIRMIRDPQTRESVSTKNLYPVGEGAGYAGGIISAAVDGLKSAETIISRFRPY
ncbi:MAG: FAD-dependent oxidoreductase [Phycisphaerae bacterium]|nr:FAD-dependent oxidoreductase [Phycisphaerae bacterium]